jgi:4-aminobutyrate aminotransferase-like enzyme
MPQIADVRGLGSMMAVEFAKPGSPAGAPAYDADFTKRVQQEAMKRGLVLLTCGLDANVIRFLYPLTIQDAVFDEALDIVEQSLSAAAAAQ